MFTCCQPEAMEPVILAAIQELQGLKVEVPIGGVPPFPSQQKDAKANSTLLDIRQGLEPAGYLSFLDT